MRPELPTRQFSTPVLKGKSLKCSRWYPLFFGTFPTILLRLRPQTALGFVHHNHKHEHDHPRPFWHQGPCRHRYKLGTLDGIIVDEDATVDHPVLALGKSERQQDFNLRVFWNKQRPWRTKSAVLEKMFNNQFLDGVPSPLISRLDGTTLETVDYEEENNDETTALSRKLFQLLYGHCKTSIERDDFSEDSKKNYKEKTRRKNFRVVLAYRGDSFCGWQQQRQIVRTAHPSVQGTLIELLDPLLRGDNEDRPIDIRVCGRTDAGVSALAQVCRVRTSNHDVDGQTIMERINFHLENVRCLRVDRVSKSFHPTFSCTCRAYAYLVDLSPSPSSAKDSLSSLPSSSSSLELRADHVTSVNRLLGALVGKPLDYRAFSKGDIISRDSLCTLLHARASIVSASAATGSSAVDKDGTGTQALCIELAADRFLRQMVRKLVATVLREVLNFQDCDDNENVLLSIIAANDRSLVAKAAPPDGLFFVGCHFGNDKAKTT